MVLSASMVLDVAWSSSSNASIVIGWTLILKRGWCVLCSEDAANFLSREVRMLDIFTSQLMRPC